MGVWMCWVDVGQLWMMWVGEDVLDVLVTGMCGAGTAMGAMGALGAHWACVRSVNMILGQGLLTGCGGASSSSRLFDFPVLMSGMAGAGWTEAVGMFGVFCTVGVRSKGMVDVGVDGVGALHAVIPALILPSFAP
jgi:hypothetical protein